MLEDGGKWRSKAPRTRIERARHEEGKLLAITTALAGELHLEPLLRMIMRAVTEFFDADRRSLFMPDPKHDEQWSQVAQGEGLEEIRFPAHLGIAGTVLWTGETDAWVGVWTMSVK